MGGSSYRRLGVMGGRSCWSKGRFLFAGGISFVKEEKTCCREWMREERRLPRPAWSLPGRTRWLRKTATGLPGAAGTWLTSRNQLRRPGRGGLAPPASVLRVEGGPWAAGARGGQGCRTAGGLAPKIGLFYLFQKLPTAKETHCDNGVNQTLLCR